MIERLKSLYEAAEYETDLRKQEVSEGELESMRQDSAYLDGHFRDRLKRGAGVSMIAEFKQASPSMGDINTGWSIEDATYTYTRGGAAAMSILTIRHKFSGSLDFIRKVRLESDIPILRKDFIREKYQILEAAALGASAILLIVGGFDDDGELRNLHDYAENIGIDVLVEAHDAVELERALELNPRIVGINNRDLTAEDMAVDLGTFDTLSYYVPDDVVLVAESGYQPIAEHKERIQQGRGDAVLMGTELMRSTNPKDAIEKWNSS